MAVLQIKNLPDDVHAALRERARREGTTMSELAVRILRRNLALPSIDDWLEDWRKLPVRDDLPDAVDVLDELRGPWPA